MDRDTGLKALGLSPGAGETEIERAYRVRSLSTKTLLLGSMRAEEKDRHRRELRKLVRVRDVALGRPERRNWRGERLGVGGRRLIDLLDRTSPDRLDARMARAFFGLPPDASEDEVRAAYGVRSRALVRAFANAESDEDLAHIRRLRAKLRTIRNFAL